MLPNIFSKLGDKINQIIYGKDEDFPLHHSGNSTSAAEYAALSAAEAPNDVSGFGFRRNIGLMQRAWDLITKDRSAEIAERLENARKTLSDLDRFARVGKSIFSNGQEFVLGITYGSNTGGIPRQIVAERRNRFKDRLRRMCSSMPNGYRPGRFEAQSNPTYGDSGKVAPAEMHMFTTVVPEIFDARSHKQVEVEYSKNLFIKRHQMQFENLNEKIVALPNGQASMFVGWALDPTELRQNGSQALCNVLQKFVDKALADGYEIAGPIGFPHIEEIRNPRNPNDRAVEFVMHVALLTPKHGNEREVIKVDSLKEIIPRISEDEKDQLKAQEGEHHCWDKELDKNCYTLGTVKVAGLNENRIGFEANIVCGFDSFEGDPKADSEYEGMSNSELKAEMTHEFFNPSARLDIAQLFYNLGIRMQKTGWGLFERGGYDARRGPTHYVVAKAPYADEHTTEYLKNNTPNTGLSKPDMYFLVELSAWRNVTTGVRAYIERTPFEELQLPHDYFRRAHELRRSLMKGWDLLKKKTCAAWTSLGGNYFYLEHMAGTNYKRHDGRIPGLNSKSGFRFSEYLAVQLKDAVNIFNTFPDAQIDEFRPTDLVFAGNFDPGSPGGHGIPTNINRLNLRIHAVRRCIREGIESPPKVLDFLKFFGERSKQGADESGEVGRDGYHRIRRAVEHGLSFWKGKRFYLCQVYQDAKLYLYEAKLKYFNQLSLGGYEGAYFSAKEHNCPSEDDQLWIDPTVMIGIDDDTFGQQGRDCHTGVVLSFNELEDLFSGQYRVLGYPKAEFFSMDTDQMWGFVHSEFGGQIFEGLLDDADEIAFSTLGGIGMRIKDKDFTREDWEGRVKEVAIWIHDEDNYHLIERAMHNRLGHI